MHEFTNEEIKEILDNAPIGATHYMTSKAGYRAGFAIYRYCKYQKFGVLEQAFGGTFTPHGLSELLRTYKASEASVVKSTPTATAKTNKYDRVIIGKDGVLTTVDVYRVLDAFEVSNPQMQHLIKKALATGKRHHKSEHQDLIDIVESAKSALEMFEQKYDHNSEV